jgi:iron complex outermembrane receptor protein
MRPRIAHVVTSLIASGALTVLACSTPAVAQQPEHRGEIEGVVRDAATGAPLAGAIVSAAGLRQRATTQADGSFHLRGIAPGTYTVAVERLGYGSALTQVTVDGQSAYVVVALTATPLEIPGLVVTGTFTERRADEALRPIGVVTGDELQRRLQGTIAATLTSEPGMAMTAMGPATARPVIRGLSGDRVLVLEDGARAGDASNSGSDHAVAIDPASVRRIEVVRGPAAILYGSNALGGVVNVIRDEVPSAAPHTPTGSAVVQAQSVSNAYSGSATTLLGLSGRIPLRLELSGRTSGDLATPMGTLRNTQSDSWGASAGSAYTGAWGHVGSAFRWYQNEYGIPGGFVGGHPDGVRIEMERASSKIRGLVNRPFGPFSSIEADATYTWYRHKEIEPPNILGTFFKVRTLSGDVLARHQALGPFSTGALGMRSSWEDFVFRGGLSTPDSRRYTAAAYAYEEIDLDPVRLEAGVRYDWVRADPLEEDPNSAIGAIRDRTFHAASGSVGIVYAAPVGVTLGASLARAFRTPDIGELYSEGPHLAAYVFEVGNPSLGTEVGTGVDAFVRFTGERLNAELTGFFNDISGFVYGEETGDTSAVQLPIYQFRGNDARLSGFEGGVDLRLTGALVFDGTASYVRASLRAIDRPLPLIPPLRGRLALEYAPASWFARVETELSATQRRIGEFESTTDGYAVFHASAGLRLTLGGRLNVLTVSAENLTDREYRNHLSRVKDIMPEAGRGVSVTYRVVF